MSADTGHTLVAPAELGNNASASNSTFLGASLAFLETTHAIGRIAAFDATVLIQGETGTGKELAARAVHYLSSRSASPFVPVNCGAISENLFESELFGYAKGAFTDAKNAKPGLVVHAEGGTLFLDEIECLSPRGQVALLRFIQDQSYRPIGGYIQTANVRIVVASNRDLLQLSQAGEFRSDLYYRLALLTLNIPPLRERMGDAELLARHFIKVCCKRFGVSPKAIHIDTIDWFSRHHWPGNVRELENLIYREMLLSETSEIRICADESVEQAKNRRQETDRRQSTWMKIPFQQAKSSALKNFEQQYLSYVLTQTKGNVSAAARMADKERRCFERLLKKNGIDILQFRG
jgi:two-component system response regulator GlrR